MGYLATFLSKDIEVEERMKEVAYQALSDIKDTTQEKVKDAFSGKRNKISMDIESPILIIPVLRNSDINSPIWFFQSGNVQISTKEDLRQMEGSKDIFEDYDIKFTQINLQV